MAESSNYVSLPINSEENDSLIDKDKSTNGSIDADKSNNGKLTKSLCICELCDGRSMAIFLSGVIFIVALLGILIWYLCY